MSARPKFAVLGTGNSGQTFAAQIALHGFEVRLAEVPEFADTLKAIEAQGGIQLRGEAGNGFAKPAMFTTDLAKAIKGVDCILIGGSAWAHEPLSKALLPHFEDGQFLVFTSNFGALRFRKWLAEAGVKTRVTPVETMSLLYATRAKEPGNVCCTGIKSALPTACLPAERTAEFIEKIGPVFPQFAPAQNVMVTSIGNLNPIVHPPMVLFNAGWIECTGGKGWSLYGDGATESVARVMEALDRERNMLFQRLGMPGICFKDSFESVYAKYNLHKPTLTQTLRNSPIHSGSAIGAPAKVDVRYLTEDIPFGLVPWSNLGRAWGLSLPTLDACIQVASVMLGRDFASGRLTLADLGLEGLTPEQVRKIVG